MKGGILKLLLLSNQFNSTVPSRAGISATTTILLRHLSSLPRRPPSGVRRRENRGENDDDLEEFFLHNLNFGDDKPNRPPSGPLTGEPRRAFDHGEEGFFSESTRGKVPINRAEPADPFGGIPDRQPGGGRRGERPSLEESFGLGSFGAPREVKGAKRRGLGGQRITFDEAEDEEEGEQEITFRKGDRDAGPAPSLAQKLRFNDSKGQGKDGKKLGGDSYETTGGARSGERRPLEESSSYPGSFEASRGVEGAKRHDLGGRGVTMDKVDGDAQSTHSLAQKLRLTDEGCSKEESSMSRDVDEIFSSLKKTGLIPSAVAMLDGLCKDGQLQEAMKLFGLMRKNGTIPEVVVYTAVVEGFCKAGKHENAKRIFRKMQNNGIVPNAFSYGVIIRGLCSGKRWDDCVEFALEMAVSEHSPNVATFTSLVDGICKDRGVDEAEKVIRTLREGGLVVDEEAIKVHLDKKGPFSPLVREAIFGRK